MRERGGGKSDAPISNFEKTKIVSKTIRVSRRYIHLRRIYYCRKETNERERGKKRDQEPYIPQFSTIYTFATHTVSLALVIIIGEIPHTSLYHRISSHISRRTSSSCQQNSWNTNSDRLCCFRRRRFLWEPMRRFEREITSKERRLDSIDINKGQATARIKK